MGTGPVLPGCVRAGAAPSIHAGLATISRAAHGDQHGQKDSVGTGRKSNKSLGLGAGAGGETHQDAAKTRTAADHQPGRPDLRQPELAAQRRARTDAAGRFHPAGKDHPFRSRAHPGAHRACARLRRARLFPADEIAVAPDQGGVPAGPEEEDRGVRPLLDGRGRRRLGRPAARRARLRGQVLHRGGQLRPRRQQHPGVLHPGRDQVSRPHPLGEDGARSRLSPGGVRARHVLGLRVADARKHAHADVGDVGPRHPALVAHDRRLRRPHLPPDQRQGPIHLREIPLAAAARRGLVHLGRGGQDQRRRPRLSPPRPVRGDREAATSRNGNSASRRSTRRPPTASTSTFSTRPS